MSNFLKLEKKRVEAQLKQEQTRKNHLKRQKDLEKYIYKRVKVDEAQKNTTWHVFFPPGKLGEQVPQLALCIGCGSVARATALESKEIS